MVPFYRENLCFNSFIKDNRHNPHLNIAFFRDPTLNKLITIAGQGGAREVFGTHHMKIYIFDNNVLVSGYK